MVDNIDWQPLGNKVFQCNECATNNQCLRELVNAKEKARRLRCVGED